MKRRRAVRHLYFGEAALIILAAEIRYKAYDEINKIISGIIIKAGKSIF